MRLTVVMPVYNECEKVEEALRSVLNLKTPWEVQVVVVDDGSLDGTYELLARLAESEDFVLLRSHDNRGKGAALRRGFAQARGDAVIIYDADLEYAALDLVAVADPVLRGQARACFGSRFLAHPPAFNPAGLFNRLIRSLTNAALGLDLTDVEPCFKCFAKDLLAGMELRADGFGIELEMTVEAARKGGVIREVPVSYCPRTRAQGKKIGLFDAFATLACFLRALGKDPCTE